MNESFLNGFKKVGCIGYSTQCAIELWAKNNAHIHIGDDNIMNDSYLSEKDIANIVQYNSDEEIRIVKTFFLRKYPSNVLLRKLTSARTRDQLDREFQISLSINHPNCLGYTTSFDDDTHRYGIMKFMRLGPIMKPNTESTYKNTIKKNNSNHNDDDDHDNNGTTEFVTDEPIAKYITKSILEALLYLHQRNIAHRDVKPDNILLGANFVPKLSDYGTATYMDSFGNVKGTEGTYAFMAPECLAVQEDYKGHDGRKADIWALGMTLWAMLLKKIPIFGGLPEVIKKLDSFTPSKSLPCDFPFSSSCRLFMLELLTIDPEKRPSAEKALKMEWLLTDTVITTNSVG